MGSLGSYLGLKLVKTGEEDEVSSTFDGGKNGSNNVIGRLVGTKRESDLSSVTKTIVYLVNFYIVRRRILKEMKSIVGLIPVTGLSLDILGHTRCKQNREIRVEDKEKNE